MLPDRQLSSIVLNKLAEVLPELIGGSADLTESNLTALKCTGDFQKDHYEGRYIRFGVREHAMFAILNGLSSYGALIPFTATFLNFIGYGLGAVRLTALSHFRGIFIMTHDSIGLGEDGPTHEPVEIQVCLRATPNLYFIRPADGREVVGGYTVAIEATHTPVVLSLTRQSLPCLPGSSAEKVALGAYVLSDVADPQLVLVGTGSEVSLCMQAAELLKQKGRRVRVVSFPCWELFEKQSMDYKLSVFPDHVPVVSVEACSTMGWAKYAHVSIGVDRFGCSAPYKDIYKKLGLVPDQVADKCEAALKFYTVNKPISLLRKPF